jgi:hypothetical protein
MILARDPMDRPQQARQQQGGGQRCIGMQAFVRVGKRGQKTAQGGPGPLRPDLGNASVVEDNPADPIALIQNSEGSKGRGLGGRD